MNKKIFFYMIVITMFLLGIGTLNAVPVAPNKAKVTGEVLSVEITKYANNDISILKLKVIESKTIEGSFTIPEEIDAIAYHKNNDLSSLLNVKKGDIINSIISYAGDERGGQWQAREVNIIDKSKIEKKQSIFLRIWSWIKSLFT